jgi:hypothetical protein
MGEIDLGRLGMQYSHQRKRQLRSQGVSEQQGKSHGLPSIAWPVSEPATPPQSTVSFFLRNLAKASGVNNRRAPPNN